MKLRDALPNAAATRRRVPATVTCRYARLALTFGHLRKCPRLRTLAPDDRATYGMVTRALGAAFEERL